MAQEHFSVSQKYGKEIKLQIFCQPNVKEGRGRRGSKKEAGDQGAISG